MFTTIVDDSGKPAGSGSRRLKAPFGVGFGLHAAGLVAILAARAWSFEEPLEPPIRIVYYEAAAPFLGDGGHEESPQPARSEKADSAASAPVLARVDPEPKAAASDSAADADARSERAGDPGDATPGLAQDEGGGTPGDPTGRNDGRENGRGRGSAADEIFRPGGDVREPQLVLRIEPGYPDAARKLHAEGLVVVEAVISGSGAVEQVRVVKSAHPLLDAAAVAAVQRWRYRPGTLRDRPVRVLLTVSVNFSLH